MPAHSLRHPAPHRNAFPAFVRARKPTSRLCLAAEAQIRCFLSPDGELTVPVSFCFAKSQPGREKWRQTIPSGTFWTVAVLYSLIAYFRGHQASHIVAIDAGQAALNPVLFRGLLRSLTFGYWTLGAPLVLLAWYGWKTVWWYAVGAVATAFVLRLFLTKFEMASGLTRNAWAISLSGILFVPALLTIMYWLVASIG
jgi:hypothetical protein